MGASGLGDLVAKLVNCPRSPNSVRFWECCPYMVRIDTITPLVTCPRLRELSFAHCNVQRATIVLLSEGFHLIPALTQLKLNQNPINNVGAGAIAEVPPQRSVSIIPIYGQHSQNRTPGPSPRCFPNVPGPPCIRMEIQRTPCKITAPPALCILCES